MVAPVSAIPARTASQYRSDLFSEQVGEHDGNSSSTLAASVEDSEVKLPIVPRGNRYANAPREPSRPFPGQRTGEISYEPRHRVAGDLD